MDQERQDAFAGVFLPALAQELQSAADRLEALARALAAEADEQEASTGEIDVSDLTSTLRLMAEKHLEAAKTGSLDQVYLEWFAQEAAGPSYEQRLQAYADRLREEEWRSD